MEIEEKCRPRHPNGGRNSCQGFLVDVLYSMPLRALRFLRDCTECLLRSSLARMFALLKSTPLGRRGRLTTAHGAIETPFFMPVGTAGAMKGITFDHLLSLGTQVLLCNTYHLHLQPGEEIVAGAGGLHPFVGWEKPILTDSGGYQVYSLRTISAITEDGVQFRSHVNGDLHFIGPKESIEIQWKLGADIIMCFDECPPSTAPRAAIEAAVDRTIRWAKVCKEKHLKLAEENQRVILSGDEGSTRYGKRDGSPLDSARGDTSSPYQHTPLLFGIVQGGLHQDLREKCARELISIGFDGYAIGGLEVGESQDEMFAVLSVVCPLLPEDQPRYLMGVGEISQMKAAIAKGIDMFDCVLPMRVARHGQVLLSDGSSINIENSAYRTAHVPIDADSPSSLSRTHFRSYLHHLFKSRERLAETLAQLQNLGVTLKAIRELRE